jgi:hypothetical protein
MAVMAVLAIAAYAALRSGWVTRPEPVPATSSM